MLLADFQAQVRGAIVNGGPPQLRTVLVGGRDPVKRFAIHQRHYEASLLRALVEKFPAVVWLVGSPFVTEAARDFIRESPPSAPCIADYGEAFPVFLAGRANAKRAPWLRWIGELEWQLGRAALATERAPLGIEAIRKIEPDRLVDCRLAPQSGLHYLAAPWPVDELVNLFLSDATPQSYALAPEDIFLEVRGARGACSMTRLDAGIFAFRKSLSAGATIGGAAEHALDTDPSFDVGQALVQFIAGGDVTAVAGDGDLQ
jgi:hypothetical protein